MFDNDFLASSKQIKLCPRDYIFKMKQEDIRDYNPLCFMSSVLFLNDIIMHLFTDITEQTEDSVQKHVFSKIQDDTIHFYKGSLHDFTQEQKPDTKKTLCLHHFIEKKLRKYLSGILYIDNDEVDLVNKINHFINDIINYNKNIAFSKTTNLYPIYPKNHVTYHP